MAVWDRDYARAQPREGRSLGIDLPPTGTLALVIVHSLAWLFVTVMQVQQLAWPADFVMLTPRGNPTAIALHPLGGYGVGGLFVIAAIWMLGGRIERQLGTRQLLRHYVLGTVLAGAAYYLLGLVMGGSWDPLASAWGALSAWCLAAWRHMRYESVVVFGRLTTYGKAVALTGAIIAALSIVFGGPGQAGWLIAVLAALPAALLSERLPIIRFAPRDSGSKPARPRRTRRPRVVDPPDAPDIDDILAKISRDGVDSLTAQERERLEEARRAKLRQ